MSICYTENKKYIKLRVVVLILIGLSLITKLVTTDNFNNNENGIDGDQVEFNTNIGIIDEQTLDGFLIKDTSLIYEDGISKFMTTIHNIRDADAYINDIRVVFKNKDNEEIVTIIGNIDARIKINESRIITTIAAEDLREAVSVEYYLTP
jgi:hypothetical protein